MISIRSVLAAMLAAMVVVVIVLVAGPSAARPEELVAPAPEINPKAAVWRTDAPPERPQAGDIWINPKDGMELVYIAAGEFLLGAGEQEIEAWLQEYPADKREWFADQQPQARVHLGGFWIGCKEVSNEEYRRFVQATGYKAPDYWEENRYPEGMEDFPVALVSWEDARAYCEWAGGTLPTELQWEKAARGPEGRRFPWGDKWDHTRCNNLSLLSGVEIKSDKDTMPALLSWINNQGVERDPFTKVGAFPSGASPYGVLDMAGNVMEWCADWYAPNIYQRYSAGDLTPPAEGQQKVLRGECFMTGLPMRFHSAVRIAFSPDSTGGNIGFRVAKERPALLGATK